MDYIAISPSGKEIATLNCNTHELKVWHVTEENAIECNFTFPLQDDIGIKTENKNWSLAISDNVGDIYIALSCFNFKEMSSFEVIIDTQETTSTSNSLMNTPRSNSIELLRGGASISEHSSHNSIINSLNSIKLFSTRVISTSTGLDKWPCIKNFYGFLQFFKKDSSIIISNNFGIIRVCDDDLKDLSRGSKYIHKLLTRQVRSRTINYHNRSDVCEKKNYEIIGFPNNIVENLEIMNEEKQMNFIKNCILCGKLIIQNEENNLEMYNLLSKNMEMLYHHSEFQKELTNNILAISKNAKLLAVTINNNSVVLYLNENSLNIARKEFLMINGKIIYMAFFNNDEKLLLLELTEKDEDKNNLIIWNIYEDSEKIYSFDKKIQILDLFGTIAYKNDSGKDFQLFDERNPGEFELKEDNKNILTTNSLETLERIIDNTFNTEPWFNINHFQISSYWLDKDEKTTRISYGSHTIQVLKNDDLIYIWSNKYNLSNEINISQDDNGNIISKVKCGDGREHEFQISKIVNECFTKDHAMGAYYSLIFFYNLRSERMIYKKLKIDEYIEKTKKIIHNVIINKPNLWRLLDVRYSLMENLIYSQSNDIIKLILDSTTGENTNCNQKLHIPQLYDWENGRKKSRHELIIALENNNIKIIQRLFDYYSKNAIENAGWMVTLTQALPKISEKFPELMKELFNHSVFYEKKMHLAKSRIKSILTSNPYPTFIVDTRLPTKDWLYDKIPIDLNDNLNDRIEIYMTPLPDFNEFLKGRKRTIQCPFFKLVSQKNLDLFYKQNPILEATIVDIYTLKEVKPTRYQFFYGLSIVGKYIIIIAYLVSTIIPYFLALMIMIVGFSFSFFVIFTSAEELGIKPEGVKYNFIETGKGEKNYSYVYMEKETNAPNFFKTLEMVYLWLFGSWNNVQDWNYFTVKILAIVASFFLILIMSNIFVALMTDDINRAIRYSEIASFKYKADFILESYLYPLFVIVEKFYSKRKKEFTFDQIFYRQPTFHLLLDRYIFYIKIDKKSWKKEISNGTDELIENLNEKVRKLNEKLDRYIT
ncbi:hypothetical protein GLOIN_2v1871247 [Rhizophagus clarus]|uniref:Ion transport domain-containing protein n=1 Tax=Rhizophagus clarus TaxID=94130 RepID=A0A8H3L1X4_9GLOM|nr:hypothetical protein GLOIN_2v1871247 [Rhizophagus clarus]